MNPTWQYELQYVGGPKFAKAKRKPGKKVAEMLAETTSFGTVRCDLSSGEDVLDVFDGDKKKLAHSCTRLLPMRVPHVASLVRANRRRLGRR